MNVNLSNRFSDINFGPDCLRQLSQCLSEEFASSKKFLLVDTNTRRLCLPVFLSCLSENFNFSIIEVTPGEQNKSLQTCEYIWTALTQSGVDKNTLLISLGGGMVGDLGGFVSSTILRGISHIQIPTTLLAMVDASSGGKTGINFLDLKNQIGTFSHPKAIYIYPPFTLTLSQREMNAGHSEIAKHALIADEVMWSEISNIVESDSEFLNYLIQRSVEIKQSFVLRDETDKNERHALNYGHTVGHAIESWSLKNQKDPLLHGEAIAIGMMAEAFLSVEFAGLSRGQLHQILSSLKHRFNYLKLAFEAEDLLNFMYADKKNKNELLNFSLIPEIGKVIVDQSIPEQSVMEAIRKTCIYFLNES